MRVRTLSDMRLPALLALVLIVACMPAPGGVVSTTAPDTTTSSTSVPTPSSVVPTTQVDVACPEASDFVDRGRVMASDQPTSDTNSLGLVTWQVEAGCERFEIEFETNEGAPATTPPTVVVEFLASRQILRIHTDVGSTVVTDQLVETPLVDRLFVVRALDGGMFVDLHLAGPTAARVSISGSPARLTLELQPALDPIPAPAVISDRVVVLSPGDGAEAGARVEVSGYARTFEANVLVIATSGDQVVANANLTAADWAETWGEFRTTLPLPPGEVSIFVGEESPEDGQLSGATVVITIQ